MFLHVKWFVFEQESLFNSDGWVEHHFIEHRTNSNIIFWTSNELKSVHLLVIKLEHPIFGFEWSNIEHSLTHHYPEYSPSQLLVPVPCSLLSMIYFKWKYLLYVKFNSISSSEISNFPYLLSDIELHLC